MGDFDKKEGFKGKEPTICKRFRWLFKRFGYDTYMINEYHTSKLCHHCHNELEYFQYNPSPKPWEKKELKLCHGLLRCQSVKPSGEVIHRIYHNRDKNAVQNMMAIVESIMSTGQRPPAFCREPSDPYYDGLALYGT